MTIVFWFLFGALFFWYLGAISFAYHVFAYRYPKDITIEMFLAFLALVAPLSIVAVSYLAKFYGGI